MMFQVYDKSKLARAVLDSYEFCKAFTIYVGTVRRGEGDFFFASPHILERKFRDGIEIYHVEGDNGFPGEWFLTSTTAVSLVDALMQVRDVVGNACGTLEDSIGHEDEYSTSDPLYIQFRAAGVMYPFEPTGIFETKSWERSFATLPDLVEKVACAQVWAMWMIAALHALIGAQGHDHLAILPPFPCAHYNRAMGVYNEWMCESGSDGDFPVHVRDAPLHYGRLSVSIYDKFSLTLQLIVLHRLGSGRLALSRRRLTSGRLLLSMESLWSRFLPLPLCRLPVRAPLLLALSMILVRIASKSVYCSDWGGYVMDTDYLLIRS